MKIIISGGHLTPALALIDFIKENYPQDKVIFVGRIFSQKKLKQLAQERNEVEKREIEFLHLKATKTIKNESFLQKILFPIVLIRSITAALNIFIKEKPDVFVSFGGYLAIPLSIAAKITKTKILTHEQTHAAGFANQFISKLADEVAISYPSSRAYFPKTKTHLTGNLIRPELLDPKPTKPQWISTNKLRPILLITGGSQGAKAINKIVEEAIDQLTHKWTVIHLCGNSNKDSNYKVKLESIKKQLSSNQQSNYFIQEWASSEDMSWIYDNSHAAISRAGANTVMELTIKNIPTIFIPLPSSHHDEQLKNAEELTQKGAALILRQSEISKEALLEKLSLLEEQHSQIRKKLQSIELELNAAKKIYQLLIELAHAT